MSIANRPGFLTREDMEAIHAAAIQILEKKGVVFDCPEAVELLVRHGARADGNIVYIPAALAESSVAQLPKKFTVHAADPAKSVTVGEGLIIHPCGGEVFLQDVSGVRHDNTTLAEYRELQKLYQQLPHVHMTGYQPLSPVDVPVEDRAMRCLYEAMLWTDKPWLAPMDYTDGESKRQLLKMFDLVYEEDFVRSHYVTWCIICPESPLVFTKVSCETILAFAEFNQPITMVSAPMSGLTAPVFNAGTLTLTMAETLAGITLCRCAREGLPVLPSASLTFGNLRSASWECASPDTAIMLGSAIDMFKRFYGLPARAQTGVTSSKCLDYQAGYETMQSLLLTVLGGVDVTSQSVGSLDNLMTISLEKTLIDDELIGRVLHIAQGIAVTPETLDLDTILSVEHGKDFLMTETTLMHCRDSWQPSVSDWNNYGHWKESGSPDVAATAAEKVKALLASAPAEPLLDKTAVAALKKYLSL